MIDDMEQIEKKVANEDFDEFIKDAYKCGFTGDQVQFMWNFCRRSHLDRSDFVDFN